MRLHHLRVENLRVVAAAELEFGARLNLIVGPNGSGKTSLLEAVHLLAAGRSFRGGAAEQWVRRGEAAALCVAEVIDDRHARRHRLGIERRARAFTARIDQQPVAALSQLFALCPAVCFEPDSGSLVTGSAELRRRYLDWGLFHVEPGFLPVWRRYQRALRQRNLLLRQRASVAELDAWDVELADAGQRLHELRVAYAEALRPHLVQATAELLPELGAVRWQYRPGWSSDHSPLAAALLDARENDARNGFTSVGPHRAGWLLGFAAVPSRDQYSRGQAKLAALAAVLAQVTQFTVARGQAPIVCLDDVAAELDPEHQRRVLDALAELQAQVLLTAADPGPALRERPGATVFHVEQGVVTQGV